MSVCSIDDFPWAPAFQPALTVVRQPIEAMAAAAFARLAARLASDEDLAAEQQVFAPELVVRQSCAALPDSTGKNGPQRRASKKRRSRAAESRARMPA
jgi:LacI family transcriptional regulator